MTKPLYKLSPSDFAYLFEECKLCYYLKVRHGIYQPSMPMPGVFGTINTHIQGTLIGKNLTTLSPDLPEGMVEIQEGWVESKPVPGTSVFIKGKYDLLAKQPDGTHMLVDLKISAPNGDKIEKYKTQLGAYKYALENPTVGTPVSVTKLGLLIFYPERVSFTDGEALLHFPPKWFDVPIDERAFAAFVTEVGKIVAGPPPQEGANCQWCKYRHLGDTIAHMQKAKPEQTDIPF